VGAALDVRPDAGGLEIVKGNKPLTKEVEVAKNSNRISESLEREIPKLPPALVAKLGAEIDPDVQLPVRVLAVKFAADEPLELVLVKPGTYNYGSPEDQRRKREISKRTVRIDQPYYIAIHETTNAQYQRFFESEGPSRAGERWQRASAKWSAPLELDPLKNRLPATNVSPEQAQAFCAWVGGRLPTEIEWESAVRGAHDRGYPFPWGSGEPTRERCRIFYGDDLGAGLGGPLPVDELAAGASGLGLMHTLGNAAEWCQSSEQSGGFVLRGCSIATANIDDIRVTWRAVGSPRGDEDTGFRVLIPAFESASEVPPSGSESAATRVEGRSTSPYWVLGYTMTVRHVRAKLSASLARAEMTRGRRPESWRPENAWIADLSHLSTS
jgi:formylglycine-generating enzyme required for sulfatase activity